MFLWVTTRNWKNSHEKWMSSKMGVIGEDDIEKIVSDYKSNLNKAKKFFKSSEKTEFLVKIAEDQITSLQAFDK
jgi:hypothetical protein